MAKAMNGWIVDDLSGTKKHYANGVLHAATGPAEIRENGTELYYQHGNLHRDGDQPAMVTVGGSLKYAKNDKYHRDNGPAIIWSKGGGPGRLYREEYWTDGEVVRAIRTDGVQVWFAPNCTRISSAVLSRKDGPAVLYQNGAGEWWLNGTQFLEKKEWEAAVKLDNIRLENEKMIDSKIDSEDRQTKKVKTKMDKPSMMDTFKSNGVEAAYRVGATQSTKVVKAAIINLMKSKGSDEGAIAGITAFLETDFGTAIVGIILGSGLQHAPHFSKDARIQKLAEEMRVGGMAIAGNAVIGEAMGAILPALQTVLNSLPEVAEEETANVTRIKGKNTLVEHASEEEATETKIKVRNA